MLMGGYLYAGMVDSALNIETELIDYARRHKLGDWEFQFAVERAQLLSEAGREDESDSLIGEIFRKAGPENGGADLLHFQYALNALNRGDVSSAVSHIAIADSLADKMRGDDDPYFRSYSNMLHAMVDLKANRTRKVDTDYGPQQPTDRAFQPYESLAMGIGERCPESAEQSIGPQG